MSAGRPPETSREALAKTRPTREPFSAIAAVALVALTTWCGATTALARVVLSEIHYNQPGPIEDLEFVEVLNAGDEAVDVGGWELSGGVTFTFRDGTRLEPGEHLVVSASLGAFLESHPGVRVAGVYAGRLSNTGETVSLVDEAGDVVDEVSYGDDPDWPLAADGEGASLERRDPYRPASFPANWAAGEPPTPGAANRSAPAPIAASAWDVRLRPRAPTSASQVIVRARVQSDAPVRSVRARLLVGGDDSLVDLRDDGLLPDEAAGDGEWAGAFGSFADRTFGRVKVLVEDAEGEVRERPVGDDESDWHGFFVDDGSARQSAPVVWLFLPEEKIRILDQNAQVRSFSDPRYPRFDETFEGYVVLDGETHREVEVRHRGGFASRHAGGLKYSWRFELPPWDQFHGREVLLVVGNMHWDDRWMRGDNGLQDKLCHFVFDRAGVPAPRTRFIRLMVNGELFGYHVEVEAVDDRFLERNGFTGLGDQYKHGRTFQAHHFPLAPGDYARAYERQNGDTTDYSSIRRFCEDLATASRRGVAGTRDYLESAVDLDNYRRYLTGIILSTHWDSTNNNIQIYRDDLKGDRWVRFPWDMDITWGYSRRKPPPSQGHDLHPHDGTPFNPEPNEFGSSALREAYLRVPEHREELHASLEAAIVGYFTEEEIFPIVDRILETDGAESQADVDKWNELDASWDWFPFAFHARFDKTYVSSRRKYLAEFLDREPLLSQPSIAPRIPAPGDDVSFVVNALGNRYDGAHDLGPSNLEAVRLHLLVEDEETAWSMARVDRRVHDFWSVDVPAEAFDGLPAAAARVWYRVSAVDDGGREGSLPAPDRDGYEWFPLDLRGRSPGPGDVVLSEIMYRSAWYDLEFVEITNNLWRAVDLSGWSFVERDEDGSENEYILPQGSIVPAGGHLVLSRDTRAVFEYHGTTLLASTDLAFSLDNDGATLFLADANGALIDVVAYDDAAPWPTEADGGGPSLERADRFSRDTTASAWVASRAQGTPGRPNSVWPTVAPPQPGEAPGSGVPFHRGDADGSGSLDLTDAVYVLSYLFNAGAAPTCLEAADTNDDGAVDLSDPVGVLAFLFLSGGAPAAPGPPGSPCGTDPGPAGGPLDLGCSTYTACE